MSSAARPHPSRCMGGAMVMGDLVLLEGALLLAPCFGAVEYARAPRRGCSPMAIPLPVSVLCAPWRRTLFPRP